MYGGVRGHAPPPAGSRDPLAGDGNDVTWPVLAPVIRLSGIEPDLYAKVEYLHPSGSIKHRALPPLIAARRRSGLIQPDQQIAVVSAGAGAVAVAWGAARIGHRAVAILPLTAPRPIVRLLHWMGATCTQIDADELPETIERLRGDPGTYLLSQADESEIVDGYRPVAREILTDVPEVKVILVGIGTGASISGIGREVQEDEADCAVIGVEPAEAPVAGGGEWRPHTIHGLAPPMPQPLLDRRVLTEIVTVPSRDAWLCAREVYRKEGLPIGPSAGATVAAALKLRARGVRGPIVAVCACSMLDYLDESNVESEGGSP